MPNLFGLNGPPRFSEGQRQLITAGLGAVPVAGPFLAGGYALGRLLNGIYGAFNRPHETNSAGFIPAPTALPAETNSSGFTPAGGTYQPDTQSSDTTGQNLAPYLAARNDLMQRIMSSPNYLNATRPAFTATVQQSHFPGSAIGNIQGGAIPFSATRGAQGLGTPNSVSTNIPAWAAANYSEILKRNQI